MQELVVGIDLGTTNSVLAYVDEATHQVQIVLNSEGDRVTPSVVQFPGDGSVLVGAPAKAGIALYPDATGQFFKPDMGNDVQYVYGGAAQTPISLSAHVLRKLKTDAEAYLGRPVTRAVITVPAYFRDPARQATIKAGREAGLEVMQILNEPTAAILAYGFEKATASGNVLVYDLGGGTFDVTLAQVTDAGIVVLATDGNHTLGGKNWDDRLLNLAAGRFELVTNLDPLTDPDSFQSLLVAIERAKKDLTARERTALTLTAQGRTARIDLTRAEFEQITEDLVEQTVMLLERVLDAAHTPLAAIDLILLVGGSTRMPMCSRRLQQLWGRPPSAVMNPDECVAVGAAIRATLLAAGPPPTSRGLLGPRAQVQDVTAHSLGFIVANSDNTRYLNSIMLKKNSRIPATKAATKVLRTYAHGPNTLDIYLLQGESPNPLDNLVLGRYTFSDVPHYQGETRVQIEYAYDANGVVQVRTFDERSGKALTGPQIEQAGLDISWAAGSPQDQARRDPLTVYLAFDLSGSMSGAPLHEAQKAALAFVSQCDLQTTAVGLISFSDSVQVDLQASRRSRDIEQAINQLTIGRTGGGNSAHPFLIIQQLLKGQTGKRYAIVLADGVWSCQPDAVMQAQQCHAQSIQIIAVGFGGADRTFLAQISSASEQSFFTDLSQLTTTFSSIARDLGRQGITRC